MVLRFFLFAGAFLFLSCTTAERNNPDDPESSNYVGNRLSSSSPVKHSSSSANVSVVGSSSSVVPVTVSSSSSKPSSSSLAKSSSSAVVSSSSSKPSSSSSVPPSSSSVAQSSSSAAVSSSSSKPSSSSSVPPSSSSLAQSSSSAVVSSSSVVVSSSSSAGLCAGFVNGTKREHYGKQKEQFCDPRDGKKYVYVEIGDQIWMAENLNYNASGSKCGNGSSLSDANTTYCNTYGRLYDFYDQATAMSVCPTGWHVPSYVDWYVLMNFIDPNCMPCNNAAIKLKTTSGWKSGNGTDDYGFSGLPGGVVNYTGNLILLGSLGTWWTSSEDINYGGQSPSLQSEFEGVGWGSYGKSNTLLNVRCLRD